MRPRGALMWAWYLQVLCLLSAPARAADEPPDVQPVDTLFASPTRIDHIGRIVVPVMIDGKGPFRMVVDTGASQSTLSPGVAERLGLNSADQPAVRVNGITGTAELPSVGIQSLRCGDYLVGPSQLPVVVTPVMSNADGILGLAGLKSQRLMVDFEHDRVVLGDARASLSDFLRVPAKRLEDGLLSVAARIGGIKVAAVIDTGAQRTLGNLALRNALLAKRVQGQMTNVYGVTTEVSSGEMAVSPPISLGNVTVDSTTVIYGDFHIFDVWNLQSKPALIIGMDVLGTVRALIIDFERSMLYVKGSQENEGISIRNGITMLNTPDSLAEFLARPGG
jgi:predicted aspartyl protease